MRGWRGRRPLRNVFKRILIARRLRRRRLRRARLCWGLLGRRLLRQNKRGTETRDSQDQAGAPEKLHWNMPFHSAPFKYGCFTGARFTRYRSVAKGLSHYFT